MATATKKAPAKKAAAKPKAPLRMVTRTFKDGRTTHWYERDGVTQSGRGVTTLLGNGLPAPALMKWAGNTVAGCALDERDVWEPLAERSRDAAFEYLKTAPDRDRDEAANRGTDVHNLAEKLGQGEEVHVPDELLGHVDAYLQFIADWEPELEMVEVVGANFTRNYYGKFDLLARLKGWFPDEPERAARILIDIKTSRSGPYEKDALQLTAYRHFEVIAEPDEQGNCFNLEEMPEVDGCAVLKLSAEEYRLVPVNPDLDRQLFAQFLHTVRTAEFLGSSFKRDDGWAAEAFTAVRDVPFDSF